MNMYPLITNIVVMERELEAQKQKHRVRRNNAIKLEPVSRTKWKKLKQISRIHRQNACEPSC
jgi:hypothetical protein